MSNIVDAKGLACPEPVILAKKALVSASEVTILVDNTTARDNVKRLGATSGCEISVFEESGGVFRIQLTKKSGEAAPDESSRCECEAPAALPASGPTVCVIASAGMGQGNDDLGAILMKAFIHTTVELEHRPDIMVLYNSGVKLAADGSSVVDDLKALEERGTKILVCGTCVNFFELQGKIAAGTVSNMYDIAGALSTAGRIVRP
jgi:selenium metabolism protein YedF